jgi:Putative Ig domain
VYDLRLIKAICATALVSLTLTLAGCGGGDAVTVNPVASSTADAAGSPATATISGTPMTGVTVGTQYSFTPTASDSDGGKLAFSIKNAPAWASFNATTGQLSGSPKATDTGMTMNIVITAADGTATAALPAFSITVTATPGTPTPTTGMATVSWVAPTANTNGTALTNLAGFKIYYGTSSASLTQVAQVSSAGATDYVVSGLTSGTWYFAVTSYTNDGTESARSAASSKTIS